MISDVEIVDRLYLLLNVGAITTAITGEVSKMARPFNSDREDVVISCLPTTNTQLQRAVANINIYTRDLPGSADANNQAFYPDTERLKQLTNIAISLLKDKQVTADFWIDVQQQQTYGDPGTQEHYTNIRVDIFNINI